MVRVLLYFRCRANFSSHGYSLYCNKTKSENNVLQTFPILGWWQGEGKGKEEWEKEQQR
jgi:hypothetical protein